MHGLGAMENLKIRRMEALTRVSDARFEWCLNVNVEANEGCSKKKEWIRLK